MIPETYYGRPVVEISANGFEDGAYYSGRVNTKGITKVVLPKTIVKIGDFAFYGVTNLAEVDLSACVDAENFGGKSLFRKCSKLATVKLPMGGKLKIINAGMFSRSEELTEITLPYSVNEIDYSAFEGDSKLAVVKQYNEYNSLNYNWLAVNRIGHHAFQDCNLTSMTCYYRDNGNGGGNNYYNNPNLVIENNAFYGNENMTSYVYNGPSGGIIGDWAFYGTALTTFRPAGHNQVGYRSIPNTLS